MQTIDSTKRNCAFSITIILQGFLKNLRAIVGAGGSPQIAELISI